MTEHESAVLKDLSNDVRTLTVEVRTLSSDLRDHATRDSSAWKEVQAIASDVWGVTGDSSNPGLKGRMLRAEDRLDGHDREFASIKENYRGGLSAAWHLITAVIAAAVGFVLSLVTYG